MAEANASDELQRPLPKDQVTRPDSSSQPSTDVSTADVTTNERLAQPFNAVVDTKRELVLSAANPEAMTSCSEDAGPLPEKGTYQDQDSLWTESRGAASGVTATGVSVIPTTLIRGSPSDYHPTFNKAGPPVGPPVGPPPSYLPAGPENTTGNLLPPELAQAAPVGPLPMDTSVAPPPYIAAQQQPMCVLSYADFMPACVGTHSDNSPAFQRFGELVQQANQWLQQNPHLQPVTCETVERKVQNVAQGFLKTKTQMIDIQTMGVSEQTFDEENIYVKGFRLWVCSRMDMRSPPPQLGYFDVTPDLLPEKESSLTHGGRLGDRKHYPGFEEMSVVMAKLNSLIQQQPIPGSVFNLQTIELRVGAKKFSDSLIATDVTCQVTQPHVTQMIYSFVRVFYIQGASTQPSIGYKDFIPKVISRVTSRDKTQDPKFERMSELHQNVQQWITSNPVIQLLNMQTLDTRHCSWAWLDKNGFPRVNPEQMDREQSEINRWDRILRISRCFYLQGNQGAYPNPPCHVGGIMMHTWPPEALGRSFEGLTPTTQRMQHFLAANPGSRVLCAETVKFDYRLGSAHKSECDRVFSRLDKAKSLYFFYAIRVYRTGPPPEPWMVSSINPSA